VGISDKDKSKIFKKLEWLKDNNKKGIGLGLCVAKRLVELHGGKIWADSKLNNGSTFYFTIPLKKQS
jgi:signal transduction histidine kinase